MAARTDTFGYTCNRCLRCCSGKRIQVNPFEVACLARQLNVSTTELRDRCTVDGAGTELARTSAGNCIFLGREGCTMHASRPLVCRLYPLGRQVDSDGSERFVHLEPVARSAGEYTMTGNIEQFLAAQDAAPFMRAADDYYAWYCRVVETTRTGILPGRPYEATRTAGDWLDIDLAIARHCEAHDIAPPEDLESRRRLHLELLNRQLESHHSSTFASGDRS